MVRQFNYGMLAGVQNQGEFSDPFPVTNGVKQGCALASTLFSMMFSAMLTDAFQNGDNGIPIRYRFDEKLFNIRRLQAKSKVQTEVLDEFLLDQVSDSCDSYNLTISIKKTEVVYQPAPGKPYKEPAIKVKGQRLQAVDKFTYLESTLSRVVHIDEEVNTRIAKARGSIWDRSGIRPDTKLKVYRSVVLPTLLYACETLTVYQQHAKRLNHFHTSCLRTLLKIKWQDRIPDTEVLKRAGMQSVHTLLKLAQLRWTGHVTRMPDERLPKKILYGELRWKMLPWWSEEAIQGHSQSLTYRLQHTNRVMGTDCTGSKKVARPHKKGSWRIRSKKTLRSRAETCTAESQS